MAAIPSVLLADPRLACGSDQSGAGLGSAPLADIGGAPGRLAQAGGVLPLRVRREILADQATAAGDLIDDQLARVFGVAGRMRRRRDIEALPHISGRTLGSSGPPAGAVLTGRGIRINDKGGEPKTQTPSVHEGPSPGRTSRSTARLQGR